MRMWLFRRRSQRRLPARALATTDGETLHSPQVASPPRKSLISPAPERQRSRRNKVRKSSNETRKLQRRRADSFTPGQDTVTTDTRRQGFMPVDARTSRQSQALSSSPGVGEDGGQLPTLLRKRGAQEHPRRKSSKKRKEEHDREAQIRALGTLMPLRPSAEEHSSGRQPRKETRKVKQGLDQHMRNRTSDISLPGAESINSTLSSMSDNQPSYVLSKISALSPRPRIRYAEIPRCAQAYSTLGLEQTDSRKRRLSDKLSNIEDSSQTNRRIDDLADDFDAAELRELMERDQSRRLRKKNENRAKLEKKLQRRQEKQRTAEIEAARNGTPQPVNMDRGVFGREVLAASSGNSAVFTSSKGKDPTREEGAGGHENVSYLSAASPQPAATQKQSLLQVDETSRANRSRDETAQAAVVTTLAAEPILDAPDTIATSLKPTLSRRSSTSSNKRPPHSWTSLFRRGTKSKRASVPSFSNASRDSMHAAQAQPVKQPLVKLSTSSLPKRTMSKFREDLPETLITPPSSRMQSPDAENATPSITSGTLGKQSMSTDEPHARYSTPTSGVDTTLVADDTPTSAQHSTAAPSPEPVAVMNQSLASIDSEGSWLSGRRNSKRNSSQLGGNIMRDSASSLQKRYTDYADSNDELGIAEDEYFSRLSPDLDEGRQISLVAMGKPRPSSDDEDLARSPVQTTDDTTEPTLRGAVGRTPTVVHRSKYAKSREGLLNNEEVDPAVNNQHEIDVAARRRSYGLDDVLVDADDSADGSQSSRSCGDSPNSQHAASLERAQSVDLKKRHVRHVSAGSARLLDLKPRMSGDSKRASVSSVTGAMAV